MIVLFLIGVVLAILFRTLKHDYARYDKEEGLLDLDRDLGDEFGWKQVHGDVFRAPNQLIMLSAMLGSGVQLTFLALVVILWTILGDLYIERATILTASIFLYAFTAMIAGYYSGSYYTKYGGKNWIRTMFFTAGLWPGIVCLCAFLINFVAIYKTSSRAISFPTMVDYNLAIAFIWLLLVFPLTLLGTIVGRNWASEASFPCRVNPIPRPIPDKPWYAEPL
ncbi:Transmembrane 9 super member 3, partial [Nowakowskiella sp. JEL0078]